MGKGNHIISGERDLLTKDISRKKPNSGGWGIAKGAGRGQEWTDLDLREKGASRAGKINLASRTFSEFLFVGRGKDGEKNTGKEWEQGKSKSQMYPQAGGRTKN